MKKKINKILAVWLYVVIFATSFFMAVNVNVGAYTTHDPIYIDGNADFTAVNGVTGGGGSQSDPYIIEGWDISAFLANGIEIRNTDAYFIVRNCYVYDGKYKNNPGIYFYNVQNGQIENTISSNNEIGIHLLDSNNNNIFNNSVNSNDGYGIYLKYSSNNTISNNSASNNNNGIHLQYSSYNNIHNNSVNSNNMHGIHLWVSSNNDIFNNSANSNNYYGIRLEYSSNNNIFDNSVNSNNRNGIWLGDSSSNNISNNSANSNNFYGIYLGSSIDNTVFNNSASNNDYGIYLQLYSSYNTFAFNNISYNNCSVEIYDNNCENNTLHHNNFINGSVVNVIDNGVNTKWNDGCGEGNYWSNYTGADDGSGGRTAGDCVGDTNIPHMGLDDYPLMEPAGRRNMPPIISSVNVSDITINSATITWLTDENSGSRVNYSINADLSSNSTKYNSTLTISHSITLTGLTLGTTYYFEVSSTDTYGNTATDNNSGSYYTFTTLEDTIPPVISSVSLSLITDHSATIAWMTDENSDSRVNYSVNADLSSNSTQYDSTMVTSHSMILTDLSPETTYYFEVGSTDGSGNSATDTNNSNYYRFATLDDAIPPTTPTGLIAIDVPNDEGGALNITWNANTEPDLDHYTLYSNKTGSWTVVAEITAGTEYYMDTGLIDGTRYYYNISASDNALNEAPQSVTASSVPADNSPPATPTGLTAQDHPNDEGGAIDLDWDDNTEPDLDHYDVYRSTTSGGPYTWLAKTTLNEYTDSTTTDGVTYYYVVTASDEVPNESGYSNEASASSLDNLPPATPTGLAVTSLRNGDLNIAWNINTDDTQTYTIYSNKTGTWTLLMNVTHPQNWYVDTGLISNTTYYYKISAWDEVPLESLKSEVIHGVSSLMGTISGVVKDKDGNPIEGATVTIYESGMTTDPVASTTTNSNGEYSVDVPPGTYDVKIEKSGYETQWEKDVEVTADQTTTADSTLPFKTDIFGDYWWVILLVIIIVVIVVIVAVSKRKKGKELEQPLDSKDA